jgi:DNA-binding transcriptional ArsR family regulator
MNWPTIKAADYILRVLDSPLSQEIIRLLTIHETMTATDIWVHLSVYQSVASSQLSKLVRAGVIRSERRGKYQFYTLDTERLSQLQSIISLLAGEA